MLFQAEAEVPEALQKEEIPDSKQTFGSTVFIQEVKQELRMSQTLNTFQFVRQLSQVYGLKWWYYTNSNVYHG